MSSYSFSFTPLPSVRPGERDVQVAMTSSDTGDTTVVEVERGSVPVREGHDLEIDRVLLDARSRISAITGLEMHEVSVGAVVRGYCL